MTFTPKNNNLRQEQKEQKPKVGLGAQTDSGYKYSSKINFKEDLSVQVARLMQEKKAKDELEVHIKKIREIALKFNDKDKEKNIDYYGAVGKTLSFLDSSSFKNIRPYSIFRRITEEIPELLPWLDDKRVRDHLMMMYKIGSLDKTVLNKATWEQWYEISKFRKFRNLVSNKKTLSKILKLGAETSGPGLRAKIESLLEKP